MYESIDEDQLLIRSKLIVECSIIQEENDDDDEKRRNK